MKTAELTDKVLGGSRLVVGTFLDWEVRETPNQKENGKFWVFTTCYVLIGRDSVKVESFADKGVARACDVKRPGYTAGQRVVVTFETWERQRGGTVVRGSVEPLDK